MPPTRIRPARIDDAAALLEVHRQSWLTTYDGIVPTKDIQAIFAQPGKLERRQQLIAKCQDTGGYWVAEEGEALLGFCVAQKTPRPEVKALYLVKEVQGRGIGRALMETALAWLGESQPIYVSVAEANTNAVAFYQRLGFTVHQKTGVHEISACRKLDLIDMIRQP